MCDKSVQEHTCMVYVVIYACMWLFMVIYAYTCVYVVYMGLCILQDKTVYMGLYGFMWVACSLLAGFM